MMRATVVCLTLAAGLLGLPPVLAPAWSPARAQSVMATCSDGATMAGPSAQAACAGHGGVRVTGEVAPNTTPGTPPARRRAGQDRADRGQPGPGQVWFNAASKVYHCQGDRFYGNTRRGRFMTEAEAKAAGGHGVGGKGCS